MLAVADIEEGVDLRKAGIRVADPGVRRAQRQRPRRRVRSRPDADDLESGRRTMRCRTAPRSARRPSSYHLKIDTGMNRLGLPPRQPAAHAAGAARQPEPCARMRCTRTSAPPTSPATRSFDDAAHAIRDGVPDARRARRRARAAPCGELRGAAARLARLVRLRAPRPAALRPGAAAAGIDDRAHARSCR